MGDQKKFYDGTTKWPTKNRGSQIQLVPDLAKWVDPPRKSVLTNTPLSATFNENLAASAPQ